MSVCGLCCAYFQGRVLRKFIQLLFSHVEGVGLEDRFLSKSVFHDVNCIFSHSSGSLTEQVPLLS